MVIQDTNVHEFIFKVMFKQIDSFYVMVVYKSHVLTCVNYGDIFRPI